VFLVGQECTHSDVLTPQLSTDPISETVKMALLDLCGKVARAPVFQVLGGPTRNKVRALTSCEERAVDQGHRAFVATVAIPNQITGRMWIL